MARRKIKGELDNYILIDPSRKIVQFADLNQYYVGELLIMFLEIDFTEFENKRVELINTLSDRLKLETVLNNDRNIFQIMREQSVKKLKEYGKEIAIARRAGINSNFSDIRIYVIRWIAQEIEKIRHPYFEVMDFLVLGVTDYLELLDVNFNFIKLQDLFRKSLEFCVYKEYKYELMRLNTMQRYYIYSNIYNSPLEHMAINSKVLKNVRVVDEEDFIRHRLDRDGLINFAAKRNFKMVYKYLSYDIASMLYEEFMQMIELNIQVNLCVNCNRFFVLKGRYNTQYCDRIKDDGAPLCKRTAAAKKFLSKASQDPVFIIHRRAYKRLQQRNLRGAISDETYRELRDKISCLKKSFKNQDITFEEYKNEMEKI